MPDFLKGLSRSSNECGPLYERSLQRESGWQSVHVKYSHESRPITRAPAESEVELREENSDNSARAGLSRHVAPQSVSQPSAIARTSTTAVYGASFGRTKVASMAIAMPRAGKMPKLHRS
jgi:hypothetical protein